MSGRKIAIVGKAPASRGLAPYKDESWEIWTLADLVPCEQAPRWDRHFEIHPWDWFTRRGDAYWPWLTSIREKPISAFWPHPELPSVEVIDWRALTEKYGRYFNNTVSWMIAFAIEQAPEEIGVWGVDMAQDSEYSHQRPSCEHFIGWARGAGIKVTVPAECDLMKCSRLYGLETDSGQQLSRWKSKRNEWQGRMNAARVLAEQKDREATYFEACVETAKYFKQSIVDDAPIADWAEQDHSHLGDFLLHNETGKQVLQEVQNVLAKADNSSGQHDSGD